jgi:hypothetical protein
LAAEPVAGVGRIDTSAKRLRTFLPDSAGYIKSAVAGIASRLLIFLCNLKISQPFFKAPQAYFSRFPATPFGL